VIEYYGKASHFRIFASMQRLPCIVARLPLTRAINRRRTASLCILLWNSALEACAMP
jgi:hypothetical protein